jgi:hypothetical protein
MSKNAFGGSVSRRGATVSTRFVATPAVTTSVAAVSNFRALACNPTAAIFIDLIIVILSQTEMA